MKTGRLNRTVSLDEAISLFFENIEIKANKNMKNLNEHSTKVRDCIHAINEDISKLNLRNNGNGSAVKYKRRMTNIVISEKCTKYGLKKANIKAIFEGRFFVEKFK